MKGMRRFWRWWSQRWNMSSQCITGHMPEIELTSPTTATGIWAMEDHLSFPAGAQLAELHGYGHYHETYTKVDGTWRIATTRLARLRLDMS